MKSILIAATIVGATSAGLILYLTNKNRTTKTGRIEDAASDAYKKMNAGIGKVERLGLHTMG